MATPNQLVMTDKMVADFFGVTTRTLKRLLDNPQKSEINLNEAHPTKIGNRRLWLRSEVEKLVGARR